MENQSSLTALMSSFGRVYHVENDSPIIFNDTLSRGLMTDAEYQQIQEYMLGGIDFFAPGKKEEFVSSDDMLKWIVQTQIAPTPLARARYCEDALHTAQLTGTTQYVILGAGMDTFAFRSEEMLNKLSVFEVDHPFTQAEKTFFSWLSVSYYLTKEQIETMLKAIESLASEGSSILFDYASGDLFTSSVKRVQNMIAMAEASGEPMKSGFDYSKLEKLLEKHHFLIYEFLNTDDIQSKYFSGRMDDLTAFEHIQYALAVLK